MGGSYSFFLVGASYVIAVIASYTALELVRRVLSTTGRASTIWLGAGSVVMGVGMWTMHFVGMIAFEMEMSVNYNIPITALSLGVAVAASWFAIYITSHTSKNILIIIPAGIFLGLGIASMHYLGMAAMEMPATISYDPLILGLSIVIAIGAALAALFIVFFISKSESKHLFKYKVGAALIMGLAICGMHYTGMAAAIYQPSLDIDMMTMQDNSDWLAAVVIGAALIILGVTHLTIFFDYKLSEQKKYGDHLEQMVNERTFELLQQTEDLVRSKEKVEKEIVERKHAENEAVYLSALLDHSSNEVYVFDSETLRYSHVNKGAISNLGIAKEKILTMTPYDLLPENSHQELEKSLTKLKGDGQDHLFFESFHTKADGRTYPVGINLQLSKVMERPAFFAIVQDISRRRDLEEKLNRAQRLESIGQLAAGVAHEINTPTQFVGDNIRFLKDSFVDLQVVLKKFDESMHNLAEGADIKEIIKEIEEVKRVEDIDYLNEEIPRAIDQSLDGTSHIANIVKAMKEFSHPGGDGKVPVNINSSIESVITVSSNEWKYAAEIETDFDKSLPLIPCYGQEFNQVMLNLIVNAAHAIVDKQPEGETEKGGIHISTKQVNGQVEIRIKDDGGGIPEAIQQKVFDPFFTTKEVGRGTGQGLSIAHAAIVDKMDGSLNFEVEEGVGTTFIISLPVQIELDEAS